MTDLEKLIRDRQDELRGRPEDWIDRLVDWESRQDWKQNALAGIFVAGVAVSVAGPIILMIAGCP